MDVKIPLQANSKVEENGKLKNLTISINIYVTDGSKMLHTQLVKHYNDSFEKSVEKTVK